MLLNSSKLGTKQNKVKPISLIVAYNSRFGLYCFVLNRVFYILRFWLVNPYLGSFQCKSTDLSVHR